LLNATLPIAEETAAEAEMAATLRFPATDPS